MNRYNVITVHESEISIILNKMKALDTRCVILNVIRDNCKLHESERQAFMKEHRTQYGVQQIVIVNMKLAEQLVIKSGNSDLKRFVENLKLVDIEYVTLYVKNNSEMIDNGLNTTYFDLMVQNDLIGMHNYNSHSTFKVQKEVLI